MEQIKAINKRIKEVRFYIENKTGTKLTQEEFATFLGITKSGVCDIERGRRNVTKQHIKLLILNCEKIRIHLSEDWLQYGIGTVEKSISREQEITNWAASLTNSNDESKDFIQQFAYMLTQLSEDEWKALEKMANIMLKARKGN